MQYAQRGFVGFIMFLASLAILGWLVWQYTSGLSAGDRAPNATQKEVLDRAADLKTSLEARYR